MTSPRALVVVLAAAGALALAGCTPGALDPDASSSPSSTSAPSATASPVPEDPAPSDFEPEPSVPPTVDPVGGDLDVACDTALTPQQVYDFNPQMLATDAPTGGLPAAFEAIVAADGVVCAWEHTSSADVLLVGVAAEPADESVDCAPLTCAESVAGDRRVLVGSQYFEGAVEQGDAIAAQVVANLG